MNNWLSSEAIPNDASLHFSSIDDLLGDSRTRFFGAGYRLIRRHISDVTLDTRESGVEANAAIEYPSDWSKKKNRELQPHLSSLDALAIAAQLAETYLRTVFGVEGTAADRLRIERCSLKPGPTPTTELDQIATRCTFVGVDAPVDGASWQRSHFSARVGTIGVELCIGHPLASPREIRAKWARLEELLGPSGKSYYGAAHAQTDLAISDVAFDRTGKRVSANLDMRPPAGLTGLAGMGAAYYPFVSEMTAIVSVAQLAQALLYRYDNLTREQSNNLWMRKIVIVSHNPAPASRDIHVETWSTKMTLLPVKDGVWRTGNFEMAMPGMTAEYTLAHQLPATEEFSAAALRESDARREQAREHGGESR
jgi:hypothetical protein